MGLAMEGIENVKVPSENTKRGTLQKIVRMIQLHFIITNKKLKDLIEMPSRYHDLGNRRQHPFGNKDGVGKGEDRQQFDKWRKDYWKARYANEMIKRGITE